MVFKHNKLPFNYDDSVQLSFQHVRQLDSGSVYESSGYGHISGQQRFPDVVRPESNTGFEDTSAVVLDGNSVSSRDGAKLLWLSSVGETVRSGNNRRPFVIEEDDLQVASKRARQTEGSCPQFHITSERSFPSSTAHDEFIRRKDAAAIEHSRDSSHGSNLNFPWFAFRPRDGKPLDTPACASSFPGYYEECHRPARYNHVEEIYSPVLNYHPRKFVALGPDHQADVPIWRPKFFQKPCARNDPDASTSYVGIMSDDDCGSDKWIGHCVMSDSVELEGPTTGHCRNDCCCCCLDEGSIRCVRQHVKEARERLRVSLGHEIFMELGFCNMGEEDVALRWSEDEEQLFHEVVMSNPVSLGKNFWDELPRVFPSRSSKEIVSYYFNVFMLRKRAEQNRSDPFNVDSDNDEWQENEFVIEDEDEDDSGVESPLEGVSSGRGVREVNIHEEAEGDEYYDDDGFHSEDDKVKFGPAAEHAGTCLRDFAGEDQDVHDDSCTSYEGQHIDVFEGLRDAISGEGGCCDPKPWEMGCSIGGYIGGFEKELDLLPTCNVIEEVFGNESWEKNTEGHGVG